MRLQILFVFYKNFCWLTIGISLFTCFLFWQSGNLATIPVFLWTKSITNGLALLFIHLFSRDKLYFFFNLGYSTRRVYTFSFAFDLLLWLLFTTLTFFLL